VDEFLIGVLSNIGLMSLLALSAWLLLVVGEISFGQQAFFALGAYAAGIATALYGWPLPLGLFAGVVVGALAGFAVAIPTMRLTGLAFAIATLAFAELMRLLLQLWVFQREVDGERLGPNAVEGFRGVRWVYDHDLSALGYLGVIWGIVVVVLAALFLCERSRIGLACRAVGADAELAEAQGLPAARLKILVATVAGGLAALGGGLYVHLATYVEPQHFSIMLGVHALAYGLIGGLGTALGPILGVVLDIGLLEALQEIARYRMIVFGGAVAVLLILRPRGLLDEALVRRLTRGKP